MSHAAPTAFAVGDPNQKTLFLVQKISAKKISKICKGFFWRVAPTRPAELLRRGWERFVSGRYATLLAWYNNRYETKDYLDWGYTHRW